MPPESAAFLFPCSKPAVQQTTALRDGLPGRLHESGSYPQHDCLFHFARSGMPVWLALRSQTFHAKRLCPLLAIPSSNLFC